MRSTAKKYVDGLWQIGWPRGRKYTKKERQRRSIDQTHRVLILVCVMCFIDMMWYFFFFLIYFKILILINNDAWRVLLG